MRATVLVLAVSCWDLVLQPGDQLTVRVAHTARDGISDRADLEIISNARTSRVLVELRTEYKGVPKLSVGRDPRASNQETMVLDFGDVHLGSSASATLYAKNVPSYGP